MADVITRFKLETTQFDSKLRDSAKSVADLTSKLMMAGKDFDRFADKNVEAAKALGSIAPSANNAKDKVKELVSAYNDAAKAYNMLTEEQKNSDYGKALADSLVQLKGKVTEAKQELYGLGKSMGDAGKQSQQTGGFMDELAKRFTLNIDVMKLFNVGLKAAETALNVAKDAFFANEQQLDEWGAIVESSESLYKGFLNAINTGDINGYLNNINQIVRAANSAYNALDALGTFNAFNQVNVERTRTNMTESIVDYREGKGDKNSVRAAGDAYKKELEERRRLEQQAYIEAVGKVAAERGVSKQDLIDALSGSYGHYQDLKNVKPTGTVTKYSPGIMPGSQGSYTTYTVAQGKQEKLGEALRQLNDTELQSLQALGAQAQRTANEIAQVDRQLVRVLNGRQGGGGGGGTGGKPEVWAPIAMQEMGMVQLGRSRADVQRDLSRASTAYNNAPDEFARAVYSELVKKFKGEMANMDAEGKPFADAYNHDFNKDIEANKKRLAREEKDKKDEKMTFQDMNAGVNQMVGGISQMTESLEQMGIDMPEGFTAVLSGLQTIASLLSAIQAISTIQTFFGKAGGGVIGKAASGFVVPGNSYSGDRLRLPVAGGGMIGVNSGEVILNRAQAGVVEQEMNHSGDAGMFAMQPYVEGEKVWLGVNNYLRRSGRGEIVTARR